VIPLASQGVQAWDRYGYANNNSLRYTDPSGHDVGCHGEDGSECARIEKNKDAHLEDQWDKDLKEYVSDRDRTSAEQAFLLFLTNPEYFALLYMDPKAWANSVDVANLDVFLQYSSFHMTAEELISSGFDLAVSENLQLAHFHYSLGDQEGMQDFLTAAGAVSIPSLIAKARALYPSKAGILQWHHFEPMYLGGSVKGVQYQIDAAYHQLITNEFRTQWGYGQGAPLTVQEVQNIMNKVYNTYPNPPGALKR